MRLIFRNLSTYSLENFIWFMPSHGINANRTKAQYSLVLFNFQIGIEIKHAS